MKKGDVVQIALENEKFAGCYGTVLKKNDANKWVIAISCPTAGPAKEPPAVALYAIEDHWVTECGTSIYGVPGFLTKAPVQ